MTASDLRVGYVPARGPLPSPHEPSPLPPEILADVEAWERLSGWQRHHVRAVERFWKRLDEPDPFRILDVGCGPGGLLCELAEWAERQGITVDLVGVERNADVAQRAQERLGDRATVHAMDSILSLGGPPDAFHLATATLILNQLTGPDRIRLMAELGRVARTAYVFDVTPTVAGEVGARLIPWLTGLRDAPPEAWVRTLERAPTLDEVVQLVAPLPVEVVRVFPSAVCTQPEPVERAKVGKPVAEAQQVRFATPEGIPGTVGSERSMSFYRTAGGG